MGSGIKHEATLAEPPNEIDFDASEPFPPTLAALYPMQIRVNPPSSSEYIYYLKEAFYLAISYLKGQMLYQEVGWKPS